MVAVNQVILVDNDGCSNLSNEKIIKEYGLTEQVKITLNGGHALLYLDHISHKIDSEYKILVLLNMDTPIADGFDFLQGYHKESKKIKNKENIFIVILSNNLSTEKMNRIKELGQANFISSPVCPLTLSNLVIQKFNPSISAAEGTVSESIPEPTGVTQPEKKEKAKRKPRKGQSGLKVA
jgi:response regulator RpfG family c-di-GMP phosphodiesterase